MRILRRQIGVAYLLYLAKSSVTIIIICENEKERTKRFLEYLHLAEWVHYCAHEEPSHGNKQYLQVYRLAKGEYKRIS